MDSLMKVLIALVVLVTGILLFMFMRSGPALPDETPNMDSNVVETEIDFTGDWIGVLEANGRTLRLVFHIERASDGSLTGTWDSIDEGINDLPISEIKINGNSIEIGAQVVAGSFTGMLDPAKREIVGSWNQLGTDYPLTLVPHETPIEIKRPQEPHPPFPYNVEDVTIPNSAANLDLAGTLTMPESGGPFPAVVMITGSGPQDRNEELLNHKPFLVIADYLTRQGIAVLRYDDRGFGESTGDFSTATSEDFATDAWAAVQYLQTRDGIDGSSIGLIGHSEGGLVAPMVAAEHDEIAFIIMLAGPGVIGAEVIVAQTEASQRALGFPADVIELTKAFTEQVFSIIMAEPDNDTAKAQIMDIVNAFSDQERQSLGITEETITRQVNQWTSPWFRYFLAYDPAPTLERVSVPVLVLNGSKDLQVLAAQNLGPIEEALKRGGNTQYEIIEYDNLNHLFQHSETGAPTEYGQIEETFAPHVLEKMGRWILERVSSDQ